MAREKSSRRSCLVVDDNYEIFSLLAAALPECDCSYAPDAFTARTLLGKKHFDVLLCDIKMPHMDGFALLEELRRELVTIPFIFISGLIDHASVRRAFQLGAANVIAKPIDLQELHDKIALAIQVHTMVEDEDSQSDQELGHIYNLLKSYYYDIQAILYQIQLYKIPIHIIKDELDKKQRIGKCFLDDPDNIKFLNKVA